MPAFDVARARRETPGCEHVVHLNNAGASLMPEVVLRTVVEHLELEARIGGYEAARSESERVEGVYDSIAALLSCDRDEVAVVENATRAWDMAFYSIGFEPRRQDPDHPGGVCVELHRVAAGRATDGRRR